MIASWIILFLQNVESESAGKVMVEVAQRAAVSFGEELEASGTRFVVAIPETQIL